MQKRSSLVLSIVVVATFLAVIVPKVGAVVASEWSLGGPVDEYVMAIMNVTYINSLTGHHTHPDWTGKEVGKFGTGKILPVSGMLVPVRSRRVTDGKLNPYACEALEGTYPLDRPWIALIKRGNCNFDRKLENAQARNAVAIIVYDHEDREVLEKMGLSNCRNCSIPGVFTYKRLGEELANMSSSIMADNGIIVEIHIGVGDTCTRPYSGINRGSVLFVSISFIVLMIISLAWLVFYYIQRFRYLHAKDRLAQRLCTAAKKALTKIPTRNVKQAEEKDSNGEADCCAVCIEFFTSGDVLRTLPCKHEFHKCCVDPWLLEHRTCPMCKMDILKYYGFIFTGSQESILHLDLEDANLNSSDSHESTTPTHDARPSGHASNFQLLGYSAGGPIFPIAVDHSSTPSSSSTSQEGGPSPASTTTGKKFSFLKSKLHSRRNNDGTSAVLNMGPPPLSNFNGQTAISPPCQCRCSCERGTPIVNLNPSGNCGTSGGIIGGVPGTVPGGDPTAIIPIPVSSTDYHQHLHNNPKQSFARSVMTKPKQQQQQQQQQRTSVCYVHEEEDEEECEVVVGERRGDEDSISDDEEDSSRSEIFSPGGGNGRVNVGVGDAVISSSHRPLIHREDSGHAITTTAKESTESLDCVTPHHHHHHHHHYPTGNATSDKSATPADLVIGERESHHHHHHHSSSSSTA